MNFNFINPKVHKQFIKLVKGGMSKPEACAVLNVGASTMRRYEQQLRNDVNYTGELAPLNNGLTKAFREKQKAMAKKTAKPTVKKETAKVADTESTVVVKKKPTQKELDKIYAKVKVKDTTKKDVSKTNETKPTSKATKPVETVTETKPTNKKVTTETKPKATEVEVKKKNSKRSKK